jgi:hypothetical protein
MRNTNEFSMCVFRGLESEKFDVVTPPGKQKSQMPGSVILMGRKKEGRDISQDPWKEARKESGRME